jgi:hypothetical protein
MSKLAEHTLEISARAVIGLLNERFTGFTPDRAYLMAGFYDTSKDDGTFDASDPKNNISLPNVKGKGSVSAKINVQLTLEQRLKQAGIPELKFVKPVVEVAVEASRMLDIDGNPVTNPDGSTKTLIKLHVYDSAMDPHATLTDIIKAAKDTELGVIAIPVASYNSAMASSNTQVASNDARAKYKVYETIGVGLSSGLLEAVGTEGIRSLDDGTGTISNEVLNSVLDGTVMLRLKSDYNDIKKLVIAGMPTITYGSSMTALTNASLSTGGSAGLANVQIQRSFTNPAEASPDNADSGVPLTILPAQLSLSTIGCPLFSPMQRFFVDFGTGTSIDNVYFVVAVDTNISKDGYKTDLKMSFGEGFASYTSLNQNLAMMAANFASVTPPTPGEVTAPPIDATDREAASRKIDDDVRALQQIATEQATAAVQLKIDTTSRIRQELRSKSDILKAKVAEQAAKARAKVKAAIPQSVQKKVAEANKKIADAQSKVTAAATEAAKAKAIADLAVLTLELSSKLPAASAQKVIDDVNTSIAEAEQVSQDTQQPVANPTTPV